MSIMTYVNKYLHAKREGFKVEQKLAKIYFFPKLLRITCTRSTFFPSSNPSLSLLPLKEIRHVSS